MTDWAELQDAYGSAEAVPGLLATAAHETAWESPVWEELWSRLYHQGSVYPASRAAVPVLVEIAQARRDVAVDPAIFLTAAILSTADQAGSGSTDPRLVDLSTHKLSLVHDRIDVLYALQCVAGVEGLTAWFEPLAGLAGEEIEVECGKCGDHVLIEVDGEGMLSTEFPDESGDMPVTPATQDDLGRGAGRLLALARDHGYHAVVTELLTLFGHVTCPVCGASFRIGD